MKITLSDVTGADFDVFDNVTSATITDKEVALVIGQTPIRIYGFAKCEIVFAPPAEALTEV
jgi:hypothetical protein